MSRHQVRVRGHRVRVRVRGHRVRVRVRIEGLGHNAAGLLSSAWLGVADSAPTVRWPASLSYDVDPPPGPAPHLFR